MISFLKRLWSPAVANSAWLGGASLVTGVLGAGTSALLGRSLGIEAFGVVTLLISLINLLTDAGDLGMTSSFVRFGSEAVERGDTHSLDSLIGALLRLKVVAGCAVVTLGFLFFEPLVEFLFGHVGGSPGKFAPLVLATAGLGIAASIFYPLYQSHKQFKLFALVSVARSTVKLAILVLLLLAFAGRLTISAVLWAEACAVVVYLALSAAGSPVRRVRFHSLQQGTIRALLNFTGWLSLYQVITLVGSRVDILMVAGLADTRALGTYGAAQKITGLVIAATNAYHTVLLAEAASTGGGERLREVARQGRRIVLVLVGGIAVLASVSGPIVSFLFGEAFRDAGTVLAWMCPGLAFLVVVYPVNAVLFALNRVAIFPVTAAVSFVVFVTANAILLPRLGVLGAAVAFSANAFAGFLVPLGYYLVRGRHLLASSSAPSLRYP